MITSILNLIICNHDCHENKEIKMQAYQLTQTVQIFKPSARILIFGWMLVLVTTLTF